MELRYLKYFVTVVEEGSISAAAKKLHLSQPPLSMQMKHLEDELSIRLFERGARSIMLTEAGRILYDRATGLLNMAAVTVREIEQIKNGSKKTLRLGMISSAGLRFVEKTLQPFHEAYPDIHMDIYEGNTYQLLDSLKNNRIEVAVVRTPFPEEAYDCCYFKSDSMMAVGKAEYFNGIKKQKLRLEELSGKPLILYRRWEQILLQTFQEEQIITEVFCVNDDARTTLKLASAGMGVALVPGSVIEDAMDSKLVIKEIDNAGLHSSLTIIREKKGKLSDPGQLFFETFKIGDSRVSKEVEY